MNIDYQTIKLTHIIERSFNVILLIAPSDVLIMTQVVCSQFGDECKECCYKSHYTHHTRGKGTGDFTPLELI